jgi:hypothetical protein
MNPPKGKIENWGVKIIPTDRSGLSPFGGGGGDEKRASRSSKICLIVYKLRDIISFIH